MWPDEPELSRAPTSDDRVVVRAEPIDGATPPTHILGTPGYVSPEQLVDPDADRPADVYSLGAILFEILAGETLHPRGGDAVRSITDSTLPAGSLTLVR